MTDFHSTLATIMQKIAKKGLVTLATSQNDFVTARSISVVVYEGRIAFQTSTKLLKFQQIQDNPNVSLCLDNLQIEGSAKIKQAPKNEEKFSQLYQKKHPSSYQNYSQMASSRVIEIIPSNMKVWTYHEGAPYLSSLNIEQETIQTVPYAHAQDD